MVFRSEGPEIGEGIVTETELQTAIVFGEFLSTTLFGRGEQQHSSNKVVLMLHQGSRGVQRRRRGCTCL